MFGFIGLVAAVVATVWGYMQSRSFVRRRLRYVEAVHTFRAPLLAGTIATFAAAPFVWVLPIVGAGTAIMFGLGVGAGVSAGSKDIQQRRISA
jgi:hypothetical protein